MTRIIISQVPKCNGNHKEVAGGCKLKIAQSERLFIVLVKEEPKFFSPWVLFST